jgi:hypothetical protein
VISGGAPGVLARPDDTLLDKSFCTVVKPRLRISISQTTWVEFRLLGGLRTLAWDKA